MLSDGQPGIKYVMISKIKKHNPELFPIDIIIYQNIPEWLQEERKKWYNLMIGILIKEIGENSINIIHKNSLEITGTKNSPTSVISYFRSNIYTTVTRAGAQFKNT